jgi:hypothetical protein
MKTIAVPGRCRCGRVRFVLREEPIAFYLCHCTDCQAEVLPPVPATSSNPKTRSR